MDRSDGQLLGSGLLILAALIWGTAFVFQRVGMDVIEPITFNACRMALSAVAVGLVAFLAARRRAPDGPVRAQRRRATLAGGALCGVFLSGGSLFQQMGLVDTSAGKAGFITAMYMLLVPVVNFLLFKKRVSWLAWLAVLTGVAGMYLLCVRENFSLTRGDALVFVCAIMYTGHILCVDHFAPRSDPIAMSAIQFVVACGVSAVMALLLEAPTWQKVASAAVPILYCGIMSGGVGYTLQIVAQRRTAPVVASLLMSLESVFAALAGALFLNERMTPREVAGCAVMFIAILLVQLPLDRITRLLRRRSA